MGEDPHRSVVNTYGQTHDIPNLFVTDTSVFPTGGGANITLTAMAIALRAADYIVQQAKAGYLN
jgi:choline dehydrogenase-like flavoprotein